MLRDRPVTDVTTCDAEPIHTPGSIQPHGIMMIADGHSLLCVGEAGDVETFLGRSSIGLQLGDILEGAALGRLSTISAGSVTVLGRVSGRGGMLNAVAYRSGDFVIVEMDRAEETAVEAVPFLVDLDAASARFERSVSVAELCRNAAFTFRQLTGYDRIMIYQFLDDDAGVVVGESVTPDSHSFMNHHFPASDIPRQARALYIRNKVRVIPDIYYIPRPISSDHDLRHIDLSDSTLRSVSPIHIQYLKNMGVGASASFSIIKDGVLWGLIACHHREARTIPLSTRMGCQALANALSRQIRAKEDAELLRERIRLRSQEDAVLAQLGPEGSLDELFKGSGSRLCQLLSADGFAAVQGRELYVHGKTPDNIDVRRLAEYIKIPASQQAYSTASLSTRWADATAFTDVASGLLAVTMSTEVPTILLWFRAEHIEVLKWAGNPHKDVAHDPAAVLTPRSSFEAWTESVRGKAKPWTHAEVESASRIVRLMLDYRNNQRLRELDRELTTSLRENQSLVTQKDYLLKEVNHRVQNSLQLVSAFLRLQARGATNDDVKQSLDEAQKRLNAVALVHRRLYQDESVEIIDLSRYIESLIDEMTTTMDAGWRNNLTLDLAPILIATDKAVNVGLILTELVINAQKYAYDGAPGLLSIKLEQHRNSLRLIVSDSGRGKANASGGGGGFGSRILTAIIERLKGHIDEEDNMPGLRVVVTASIQTA
jgi:two-component system, chemotaxis family, sensor kinase Cph1